MRPDEVDPTAGESARSLREHRPAELPTDPTAGERARAIGEGRPGVVVTDPTDPRYGMPVDPGADAAAGRSGNRPHAA